MAGLGIGSYLIGRRADRAKLGDLRIYAYLELAIDYGNYGFWDEAIEVLSRVDVGQVEDVDRGLRIAHRGHAVSQIGEGGARFGLEQLRGGKEMRVDVDEARRHRLARDVELVGTGRYGDVTAASHRPP